MWPEVMESVIGRRAKGVAATLLGYDRLRIKNRSYPALVAAEGRRVCGVLYAGITAADFEQLDRFEGNEYQRIQVFIEGEGAHTYLIADAWRHTVEDTPWLPEEMPPEKLAAFCREGHNRHAHECDHPGGER